MGFDPRHVTVFGCVDLSHLGSHEIDPMMTTPTGAPIAKARGECRDLGLLGEPDLEWRLLGCRRRQRRDKASEHDQSNRNAPKTTRRKTLEK
jgi:hypothetical protein